MYTVHMTCPTAHYRKLIRVPEAYEADEWGWEWDGPQDLQTSAEHNETQQAVEEAERDIAEGNWVENSEVLGKLKQVVRR